MKQSNTSQNMFKEICDYCYSEEQITLSAYFINTPNVEKLLSVKPISSACVGYDIMGLLEQNKTYKNQTKTTNNEGKVFIFLNWLFCLFFGSLHISKG